MSGAEVWKQNENRFRLKSEDFEKIQKYDEMMKSEPQQKIQSLQEDVRKQELENQKLMSGIRGIKEIDAEWTPVTPTEFSKIEKYDALLARNVELVAKLLAKPRVWQL